MPERFTRVTVFYTRRCWAQIIMFTVPPSRCSEYHKTLTLSGRFPGSEARPESRCSRETASGQDAYTEDAFIERKKNRKQEIREDKKKPKTRRREGPANTDALLARVRCNRSLLLSRRSAREEHKRKRNKTRRTPTCPETTGTTATCIFYFQKPAV